MYSGSRKDSANIDRRRYSPPLLILAAHAQRCFPLRWSNFSPHKTLLNFCQDGKNKITPHHPVRSMTKVSKPKRYAWSMKAGVFRMSPRSLGINVNLSYPWRTTNYSSPTPFFSIRLCNGVISDSAAEPYQGCKSMMSLPALTAGSVSVSARASSTVLTSKI